jgi:CelD/BcsL family acetyltransferase involved in cellulose biosynthesis
MRVVRFSDFGELAPCALDWDRLAADNPFRSWAWASTWWRHYGAGRTLGRKCLCVLGVKDEAGRLVGIAPWYVQWSPVWGRVLRFIGSGEVCSEYLGVLAEAGQEEPVAAALADWLAEAGAQEDRWDLAELTSVDAEDLATGFLIEALRSRELAVHCRRGPSCWRIELPGTWQEYLATLSRSRRKKIHRAENQWIKTGRAELYVVDCPADLARAQEILIDLHRRRRESLGQEQCFISARCIAFHREVMSPLLDRGRLKLYWIAIDGEPVAAEYIFSGGGVLYGYQAGMAPESVQLSPGHFGKMIGIRGAIAEGYRAFDFLRGDEPYKAHWRAAARAIVEFRVAAPRRSARVRLRLWLAGSRLKQRVKGVVRPAPPSSKPYCQAEGPLEEPLPKDGICVVTP